MYYAKRLFLLLFYLNILRSVCYGIGCGGFQSVTNIDRAYAFHSLLYNCSHNAWLINIPANNLTVSYRALRNPNNVRCAINFSNNAIEQVGVQDFGRFTCVVLLDLNYNQITSVAYNAFAGLQELRNLELAYNKLTQVDFRTFTGLRELLSLRLSGNDISYIQPGTFRSLNKLSFLGLNLNKLESIRADVFANGALKNIEIIYLASNNIKVISEYAFSKKSKLKVILLTSNNLREIRNGTFDNLPNLFKLNLLENPNLSCNVIKFLPIIEDLSFNADPCPKSTTKKITRPTWKTQKPTLTMATVGTKQSTTATTITTATTTQKSVKTEATEETKGAKVSNSPDSCTISVLVYFMYAVTGILIFMLLIIVLLADCFLANSEHVDALTPEESLAKDDPPVHVDKNTGDTIRKRSQVTSVLRQESAASTVASTVVSQAKSETGTDSNMHCFVP